MILFILSNFTFFFYNVFPKLVFFNVFNKNHHFSPFSKNVFWSMKYNFHEFSKTEFVN